ncbi:MAG: hypothetical protein KJO69_07480, partial [Gammaproteobacteria bacterium]|nr:hypothetical protein [Gammaproteobacteria bacterium]
IIVASLEDVKEEGSLGNSYTDDYNCLDVTTTNMVGVNNIAADPLLDSNYKVTKNSPCVGAGVKWWTGANPQGLDGEPFSDIDTDIGANQSTYSPFHPVNLRG